MLDAAAPAGELSFPDPNVIFDPHVSAQDIAAPAVVIPRNHQHRRSRLAQVSERGEHPKARARDNRSPLEPKLEEIAIDDERTGPSLQLPEKLQYVTLHLQLRKAEMQVGNHVAW